jgi:hypothetical protein
VTTRCGWYDAYTESTFLFALPCSSPSLQTPRCFNKEIYLVLVNRLPKSPFPVDSTLAVLRLSGYSRVRDTPHNLFRIKVLRKIIHNVSYVFEISVLSEPAKSFAWRALAPWPVFEALG